MKKILLAYRILLLSVLSLFSIKTQGQQKQSSICNPVNLNYRFQLNMPSRREAADPTVVAFKGKYYLFASKSGGYWSSSNLIDWDFIATEDLPLEDYAPTAVVIDGAVYFMALDRKIYKSDDPSTGRWQVASKTFSFLAGDPALFLDDDGRLYLYHGLSNYQPIYGIELDKKTFKPIGKQVECFNTDIADHGWERRGDHNTETKKPYLEGAWMNKYKGKYYLQYSSPGTQYKSYSDGLYIGTSALGPFTLAENNPFSYKPEGFINGAGHGSTFQDKWGNYWHMATMTISVKEKFERRLGLFPAFYDKEGMFYTYTAFGDFPHTMPTKRMKGPQDYQPKWMLLSYNKPVQVSSSITGHPKENITGEDIRHYWSAATRNIGEWAMVDLQSSCVINALQINFFDEATTLLGRQVGDYYQYLVEYSGDKISWNTLVDKTLNKSTVPHDYIELSSPVKARYIRLTNFHVPDGKFAISGLRIFGKGTGKSPKAVSNFNVLRNTTDARDVKLEWTQSPGAMGYNIRFGIHPDKLYQTYQVLNATEINIHSLNRLQYYYFAIDAFNENGTSKSETVIKGAGTKEQLIKENTK